jgi:hypothetical protein
MFENIGKKIKSLVVIITSIEFVLFIIAGIALIIADNFLLGILVGGLGCLFAWLTSFFMYAFGEIVDKVQCIEENARLIARYTSISAHYQKNNADKN